jgi:hypothetical protein
MRLLLERLSEHLHELNVDPYAVGREMLDALMEAMATPHWHQSQQAQAEVYSALCLCHLVGVGQEAGALFNQRAKDLREQQGWRPLCGTTLCFDEPSSSCPARSFEEVNHAS